MIKNDYTVLHLGEGKFQVEMDNGDIKGVGPGILGMIRYTYFEDYTLPETGWQVSREQLMKDYIPKMIEGVMSGKLKPNQINY